MIKVGDNLPAATLMEYVEVEGNGCSIGPNPVDVVQATAGKTVALFALPGAFTPTCSAKHVPGYVEHFADFKAAAAGAELPASYDPPAACLVLVKRYGNAWQALRLGDSCLLARENDGRQRIHAASPNNVLDHWLTREVFNAVYVSRTRTDDQDPLEPLVEALKNGDSLVIFPEGTRSNKGLPQPFKSGLFHLAEQFPGVQLIPAWIDNVQRVMPKGEVVPVPILCSVTFGAPVQLGEGEDRGEFLARARQAVIALRDV